MSKAMLLSIQPKWCDKIAGREKTVEVRKTCPALDVPFRVYIYRTKGFVRHPCNGEWFNMPVGGHVIGEFVCDQIINFGNVATDPWNLLQGGTHEDLKRIVTQSACLTESEMLSYRGKYGWHISELEIYNQPKDLSEFRKPCKNDLFCEECALYSSFLERCGNEALALRRAPQSWCYVSEPD